MQRKENFRVLFFYGSGIIEIFIASLSGVDYDLPYITSRDNGKRADAI
jgi:hypothetical protein